MHSSHEAISYDLRRHFAPTVRCAVEMDGITVIDGERSITLCLHYPEAALWDLMWQGYTLGEAVPLLRAILSSDEDTAAGLVQDYLPIWLEMGFIVTEPADG